MKRVVLAGVLGALLGGLVAYIGATRIFVCRTRGGPVDGGFYEVLCASPDVILALLSGIPIGLGVGIVAGLALAHLRPRPN
jgi:hypothetical protein